MAPLTTPELVTLQPWPLLYTFEDGLPAIGAALWSYVPSTSTPKSTFSDPLLIVPNANPLYTNDQGYLVAYLDGRYDLRLYNSAGVLLWELLNYQFATGIPEPSGTTQQGTTQQTVTASPGASVLTASAMAPVGYRVLGVLTEVLTGFGTSSGLTGLLIGDAVANDRWGVQTTLTAGATTGQLACHGGDEPIAAPSSYTVLVSALGGTFDATGSLALTAYWEALVPPA